MFTGTGRTIVHAHFGLSVWPALAVLVCSGAIATAAVTSRITVDEPAPSTAGDATSQIAEIVNG